MISEENNKALGRFIDLAMLNIGCYYIKENRMGAFGYLSAAVTRLSVELGGQAQLSKDSTEGFVQLENNALIFDENAPVGATAKLGIKQSGGIKALVITKNTADTVVILYQE